MDNKSKIACCNICFLAVSMRACISCPFNPANLELKRDEIRAVSRVELLTRSQKRQKENIK
jgi:hypothetical protein